MDLKTRREVDIAREAYVKGRIVGNRSVREDAVLGAAALFPYPKKTIPNVQWVTTDRGSSIAYRFLNGRVEYSCGSSDRWDSVDEHGFTIGSFNNAELVAIIHVRNCPTIDVEIGDDE